MFWDIAVATIEDLAFGIRSSRGPDKVGRRVCLSGASYAAAEKSEWRMALKNLIGSEAISQNICFEYGNQLSRNCRCFLNGRKHIFLIDWNHEGGGSRSLV